MNSASDMGGSARDSAKTAAAKAGDNPAIEWGARLGFGANGVIHLLLAYLTLRIALGGGGKQASQSGALATLAQEPAGRALLWVLVAGFTLLALWHATEVIVEEEALDKIKAAGQIVLYGALAWSSATFAAGGGKSSNKQTQDFTVKLMGAPAGRLLVGLVGMAIIGVAVYHVYKGWREKFLEDLQEHPGRWATVAGKIGYIAKGVALTAVGILFVSAALQQRASKATGLDGGLRSLRDLPAGTVILLCIAVGLVAYGVYSFARARYARI